MTRAKGYSLWLLPTGDVHENLAQTIRRLSQLYETPTFEPHLTLLGGLGVSEDQALLKTRQLSTLIRPFEVRLGKVDYLDEYFRCLFLRVEETKQLGEANLEARKIFDGYSDPKIYPHLSLKYGRLGPSVKQTIVPTVAHYCETRFEVKSICLFLTEGEPGDWYRVRQFPLG